MMSCVNVGEEHAPLLKTMGLREVKYKKTYLSTHALCRDEEGVVVVDGNMFLVVRAACGQRYLCSCCGPPWLSTPEQGFTKLLVYVRHFRWMKLRGQSPERV